MNVRLLFVVICRSIGMDIGATVGDRGEDLAPPTRDGGRRRGRCCRGVAWWA